MLNNRHSTQPAHQPTRSHPPHSQASRASGRRAPPHNPPRRLRHRRRRYAGAAPAAVGALPAQG